MLIRATAVWDEKPWCSHPSKSGRRRPLLRFESRDIVDEPACLEGRAAQRCTKVALCLEPVLGAVASVSQASPFAQSHPKPMCRLGYLKYLQRSKQFWTNTETHTPWRKCSEHTEAPIGGGSGGEGFQPLGSHAHVQRIPHSGHECLGIVTATHEKRVRKDLFQGKQSSQPPLLHHFGCLRTSRGVVVMVAGRWIRWDCRDNFRTLEGSDFDEPYPAKI